MPQSDTEPDDVRTVYVVYVRADKVICPHCEEDVDGWGGGDPRGSAIEKCDACGGLLRVAVDAEVRLV